MSPAEWMMVITIVAVWLFLMFWFRRYFRNTVAKTGKAKEINEATTRLRAYGSTILGGALIGYLLYLRENIPPQNKPVFLSSIALIILWIGYSWLRWLRLRRH